MGDISDFRLDGDLSLTAARLAWRLGTKIGSELGKLVDEKESMAIRPSGGRSDIDFDDLPDPLFDYENL